MVFTRFRQGFRTERSSVVEAGRAPAEACMDDFIEALPDWISQTIIDRTVNLPRPVLVTLSLPRSTNGWGCFP